MDRYTRSLVADIREKGVLYGREYMVDTIFIGGGTPSLLSSEAAAAILGAVRESFIVESEAEITIEANPKTLNAEKLMKYRKIGINRLSIGVQSFDNDILKFLGRIHTAEDALYEFMLARESGFDNINLDLMFGLPNQGMEMWIETLDKAVELNPEHISFYSLQIEEDTAFYDDYIDGKLMPANDDLDRKMYHEAIARLADAGIKQYEISSAAKPGFECRHNLKYWSFEDYLGIGESASSFIHGIRVTEEPRAEYHENDDDDSMSEFVFTGLRKISGINKNEFRDRFGRDLWDVYTSRKNLIEPYIEKGFLIEEDDILRLSEYGFDISNQIMSMFV